MSPQDTNTQHVCVCACMCERDQRESSDMRDGWVLFQMLHPLPHLSPSLPAGISSFSGKKETGKQEVFPRERERRERMKWVESKVQISNGFAAMWQTEVRLSQYVRARACHSHTRRVCVMHIVKYTCNEYVCVCVHQNHSTDAASCVRIICMLFVGGAAVCQLGQSCNHKARWSTLNNNPDPLPASWRWERILRRAKPLHKCVHLAVAVQITLRISWL